MDSIWSDQIIFIAIKNYLSCVLRSSKHRKRVDKDITHIYTVWVFN